MPTDLGKLEDRGLLLMNLAYRFGPEVLAKTVGQVHKAEAPLPEAALLNAECAVLATAEIKANLGLLGKDQPESAILKALLVEKAKQQPDEGSTEPRMGLEALSYDQGAMFVFKKLVTNAALERLKLAGSYDSQQAAAAAQLTFKFAESLSSEIGISPCKVLPPNPDAKPESNHPGPESD